MKNENKNVVMNELSDEQLMEMVGGYETGTLTTVYPQPYYGIIVAKYGVQPYYGIKPMYGIITQPLYGIMPTEK